MVHAYSALKNNTAWHDYCPTPLPHLTPSVWSPWLFGLWSKCQMSQAALGPLGIRCNGSASSIARCFVHQVCDVSVLSACRYHRTDNRLLRCSGDENSTWWNRSSMRSRPVRTCPCARECRDLFGFFSRSFLNQLARKSRILDTNTHQTAKASRTYQQARKALGNDALPAFWRNSASSDFCTPLESKLFKTKLVSEMTTNLTTAGPYHLWKQCPTPRLAMSPRHLSTSMRAKVFLKEKCQPTPVLIWQSSTKNLY